MSSADRITEKVGLVLGSMDSTPLDLWIGVEPNKALQLDDLVAIDTKLPDGTAVKYYGMIDIVRKRYEGATFDGDAFRAASGTLPVEVSYAAHAAIRPCGRIGGSGDRRCAARERAHSLVCSLAPAFHAAYRVAHHAPQDRF